MEKNRKMALSYMQYDRKYRGRAQCWYRRALRFIEFIIRKTGGAGKKGVLTGREGCIRGLGIWAEQLRKCEIGGELSVGSWMI